MVNPLLRAHPNGLRSDFYLLVLAAVYHADGLWGEATFDLCASRGPTDGGPIVVGGVEDAIDAARGLGFSADDVRLMRGIGALGGVSEAFWEQLRELRFSGEIVAMPEGTLTLPGAPILRVTAPLIEVTLLETALLQAVSFGSAVATRAARLVDAAQGRRVFDLSTPLHPSPDAAARAARAALVGGVAGSGLTETAIDEAIPPMGTLSQGFYAAYGDLDAALEAFRVYFPDVGYVSLPPGDMVEGVLALSKHRKNLRVVRLDHDDLNAPARRLRGALNVAGMSNVLILGGGELDEARIAKLVQQQAPVDLFAVDSALSQGLPSLGLSYRIADMQRGFEPEALRHPGAAADPGVKQTVRFADHDLLCLESEVAANVRAGATPLARLVVSDGERVLPREPVEVCAARRRGQQTALRPGWTLKRSAGLTAPPP